jgi:hypothetical protein
MARSSDREIVGCFKAVVAEPENVEADFVALEKPVPFSV